MNVEENHTDGRHGGTTAVIAVGLCGVIIFFFFNTVIILIAGRN